MGVSNFEGTICSFVRFGLAGDIFSSSVDVPFFLLPFFFLSNAFPIPGKPEVSFFSFTQFCLFGTRENEEMKLPASHDLADVMREIFFLFFFFNSYVLSVSVCICMNLGGERTPL